MTRHPRGSPDAASWASATRGVAGGSSSSTAPAPPLESSWPHTVARPADEDRGIGIDADVFAAESGAGRAEAAPKHGAPPSSAGAVAVEDDEEFALLGVRPPPDPPAAPRCGGYAASQFAPAAEAAAGVDCGAAEQLREAQEAREEQQRRASPRGVPPPPSQLASALQDESSSVGEEVRLEVQADSVADGSAGSAHRRAAEIQLDTEVEDIAGISPPGKAAVSAAAGSGKEGDLSPHSASENAEQRLQGNIDLGQTMGSSIVALDETPNAGDEDCDDNENATEAAKGQKLASGGHDRLTETRLFKPFLSYSRLVSRCPCCCFFMYLILTIALTGALWRPITLDNDLSSFVRADGQALRYYDAFQGARDVQQDLNNKYLASPRRLQEAGYEEWTLKAFQIVYASRGGLSMLDSRALQEAKSLEDELRRLPGWQDFCVMRNTPVFPRWLCDPGESLLAFAWPTQMKPESEHERFRLRLDRGGSEHLSMAALFAYFGKIYDGKNQQDLRGDPLQYLPTDFKRGSLETDPPMALRSKFSFPIVYGDARWPGAQLSVALRKTEEEYSQFILEQVYPIVSTASERMQYIDVFYASSEMNVHEVLMAMETDILWALGSIGFVTLYMGYHIRSVPFTAGAFFTIFASVPVAFVLVPMAKTTFASLMSLFLITVIDIDIIFVFNDFWKQSARWEEVDIRLAWTIVRAGRSCLATSLTTSVSFFANLLSALQPLREFGLFMGLCVTNVFVLALMLLPPLIVLRERKESRRREAAKAKTPDTTPKALPAGGQEVTPALSGKADEESALEPLKYSIDGAPIEGVDGVHTDGVDVQGQKLHERDRRSRVEKSTATCTNVILYRLVDCISTCPCFIILVSIICVGLFFFGIVKGITIDAGMPDIFQPGHNQIRGKALLGKFRNLADLSLESPPDLNISACSAPIAAANGKRPTGCDLFWCDMEPQEADSDRQGTCWRGPTLVGSLTNIGFSIDGCKTVHVHTQLVAGNTSIVPEWSEQWTQAIRSFTTPAARVVGSTTTTKLEPLVMEDWESGRVMEATYYQAGTFTSTRVDSPTSTNRCDMAAVCYFGPKRCSTRGWQAAGRFNITTATMRRLGDEAEQKMPHNRHVDDGLDAVSPRRLIMYGASLPENQQINVAVIFGLWAPTTSPLVGARELTWTWDSKFEPDNPWAQRAMAAMCTPELFPEKLWVVRKKCFIDDFQFMLDKSGLRFPSRSFDDDFQTWFRGDATFATQNLWMVDGKLRAAKLDFWADFKRDSGAGRALEYKEHWDAFVAERNAAATWTGNNAWHTSEVWVRSEAQDSIISSTTNTILTELVLGFGGILAFTGDPVLALIVLALIIGNVGGLACFMVQVAGWAIGPIEIIFLVVFLGYSVTFGLHMALNYSQVQPDDPQLVDVERWVQHRKANLAARLSKRRQKTPADMPCDDAALEREVVQAEGGLKRMSSPASSTVFVGPPRTAKEMRKARTRLAVLRVGGAIFSSTVSTIGSSTFLLFCTLNIFIRLGLVIIAVVILSLVSTLIVLPAVLLLIGPKPNPCYKRIPAELFEKLRRRVRPSTSATESKDTPLLM